MAVNAAKRAVVLCLRFAVMSLQTQPMTQRRQVKRLKVKAVDPALGVHRIVRIHCFWKVFAVGIERSLYSDHLWPREVCHHGPQQLSTVVHLLDSQTEVLQSLDRMKSQLKRFYVRRETNGFHANQSLLTRLTD
jgi:hypothetical protein